MPTLEDADLADEILGGGAGLDEPGLLAELKTAALEKLAADVPKYPALEAAWEKWVGED
jgi:hypothetical protein